MTAPRFTAVLIRAGVQDSRTIEELLKLWKSGLRHVIESEAFTKGLIDAFIESEQEIDLESKYHKPFSRDRDADAYRKIYYRNGKDVVSLEYNADTLDGAKAFVAIHETCEEIIAILKKVADFPASKENYNSPKDVINIYEHDFFFTNDSWSKGDRVIIAGASCFRELLYTPKYGYLTAKGDISYDSIEIDFPSAINETGNELSEYQVTSCSDYRYAGNLITDMHLLKNPKVKK